MPNTDDGGEIARIAGVDVFPLICLNLDQPANSFTLAGSRIINGVAFRKLARINSEEDQLTNKWIAPELERQGTEGAIVVGESDLFCSRIGINSFCRRGINWALQLIDPCIT